MSPGALGAIIQVLAILLGLVLVAYVLFHERAELSLDYLQRRQTAVARQLATIMPALVDRFREFQTNEPYWQETYRNLSFVSLALSELVPDMDRETHAVSRIDQKANLGEVDALAAKEVTYLVNSPETFFVNLLNLSKLAPLEAGYPQRSMLSDYRREYKVRLARHIHTVERAHWLNKGPGRALPLVLTLALVFGICLLLFSETNVATQTSLWGRNVLFILLLLCLGMFVLTIRRILQPAGRALRSRQMLRWLPRTKKEQRDLQGHIA